MKFKESKIIHLDVFSYLSTSTMKLSSGENSTICMLLPRYFDYSMSLKYNSKTCDVPTTIFSPYFEKTKKSFISLISLNSPPTSETTWIPFLSLM